jgi:hypothetical protein
MEQDRVQPTNPKPPEAEESLVPDMRGQLTPAQMVERKLVTLMKSSPVLISHLQEFTKMRPA